MMEKKFELDPQKVEKFGPLPNNYENLSEKDFVTEQGTKRTIEIFGTLIIDKAIKHWDLEK